MLVIPGRVALSDFRKRKVLADVRGHMEDCLAVEARYVHFVDSGEHVPDHQQRDVLEQLLDYGKGSGTETQIEDGEAAGQLTRIAIPRIGTISPWASKATDIVHLCGLNRIRRVERGISWTLFFRNMPAEDRISAMKGRLSGAIFDPMIETLLDDVQQASALFSASKPGLLNTIDILGGGEEALAAANLKFGFALSNQEQQYLMDQFSALNRNPTDVELMMFAQVNSEHCRHKIFNADWIIDGKPRENSLFGMIRTTHEKNSHGTLVAYKDNAAILEGSPGKRFQPLYPGGSYEYVDETIHFTAKVETHNHPTAICPYPGAATGSGGEIRDEGATGRGGKPKAGLCGFFGFSLKVARLAKEMGAGRA